MKFRNLFIAILVVIGAWTISSAAHELTHYYQHQYLEPVNQEICAVSLMSDDNWSWDLTENNPSGFYSFYYDTSKYNPSSAEEKRNEIEAYAVFFFVFLLIMAPIILGRERK